MADTPVVTPGNTTSEHKLTVAVIAIGTVLEALSGVLHQFADGGLLDPSAHWYTVTLLVVGVLLQLASVLGYQKSRAVVKSAAVLSVPSKPSA